MSDNSSIEWTDATWSPVRGCTRISSGCGQGGSGGCYAERMAARFSKPGMWGHGFATMTPAGGRWTGKVELDESVLEVPGRWNRPRKIFVCSTSDLFHESLPFEAIDQVFYVMRRAKHHTFQVLTKRPQQMLKWADSTNARHDDILGGWDGRNPLPNVWIGVSVEDQATADARIPLLLQMPASVRFVSYEPALGPVDFLRYLEPFDDLRPDLSKTPRIDQIIIGGESGPGARPFDIAWARGTIEQCKAAGAAAFCKQLGARPIVGARHVVGWKISQLDSSDRGHGDEHCALRLKSRKGGDMSEWPSELRVRQFPK